MAMTLDSENDWIVGARHVISPNTDDREPGAVIDALIVHGISLPPGEFGGPYVDQLFTNTLCADAHPYFTEIEHLRVSAHLFIDRHGAITQYVPFSRRARHAGASILHGREDCNEYSIGIELEGCDDQPYTARQYEVLAEVTRILCRQWPGICRERIVGHCDVAPGRKTDPGPAFDWEKYFSLLEK